MRFLRPEALWLLLAALPLVLLHLRRVRRRVVPVASIRLWQDLAQAGVGRSGFRRVREVGALAILLAALLALTGALSDPVVGAAALRPRSMVIVIDASVTMNARAGGDAEDAGETRFDAALEAGRLALDRMGPDDDVTIWLAEPSPWVLAGPTRDTRAARAALQRLTLGVGTAEESGATLEERALDVALDRVRTSRDLRRDPATILVITDPPGAASLEDESGVIVAAVGAADANNVAVTRVTATPRGVRVEVAALEGDPGDRTLRVTVGEDVVAELPLTLAAGRTMAPEVLVPQDAVGRLVARLLPADDFPEDDANGLVLRRLPPLRVLVTAEGGRVAPYLLEALRALPGLVDADSALVATPDAARDVVASADVIVADGAAPDALGDAADGGGGLLRPFVGFVEAGESVSRPLLWGVGSHPVLEGVDLSPLRLEQATPLPLRPGEVTLVDSAAGPLAVAGERDGVRFVRFGFRPDASTLPLEAAFPLLVRNSLRWVREGGTLPSSVFAGDPLGLAEALPPDADEIVLSTSSRSRRISLGPDTAEPTTPLPWPGESRVLRVGLPGGAALGDTVVQWRLPDGTRLGSDAPPPALSSALAALPPPLASDAPLRHLAPVLSAIAAVLLLLGAALLSTGHPADATTPVEPTAAPRPLVVDLESTRF